MQEIKDLRVNSVRVHKVFSALALINNKYITYDYKIETYYCNNDPVSFYKTM